MCPRRIYFLAKAEYFTGTGLKGGFQRWFYTAVGQIPIDRSGAEAAAGALTAASRQLEKGELMGMYPEAPDHPTVGSTRARPGSRGSLWRPGCR